ncbi:acyltransferase [uncultured Flavobacterium sp.]|uniref:acyltransferase n=1 Tax=uncultured Flavobacterium sp. TaxID=165435 RepID=UPI0025EA6955|nr:acyltransferase [uncultured Flavobacterium sp.]
MKKQFVFLTQSILKRLLGMDGQHTLKKLKEKGLKVGNNFYMQEGCIIDGSHCQHIAIGDDVCLSANVHILAHDASTWWFLGHTRIKNTTLGNRVFVGAGSIIMPGVSIGNDTLIGAGSVVTKDVPDNCIHAGNPAKFLMNTNEYIAREKAKMNDENTFDEQFHLGRASADDIRLLKEMAHKHGTAYLK